MKVDPNQKLLDLDPSLFKQLEDSLRRDDGWRKVADTLKEFGHLRGRKLLELSRYENPATRLLEELKCRLYKIWHLKELLRRCQLFDALAVIADPEPLAITRQPSSFLHGNKILKVKIGNPFSLGFEVIGVPPPKYSWFVNGLKIVGKNSTTLNYDFYDPSLEGLYTCAATQYMQDQKLGELFSEVIIVETLPEAPIITQDLESHISLCEGSPILLKIKATAYPPPTFEWLHGNEVLTTETNDYFYRAKSTKSDGGIYKCHVKNCAGTKIVETNVVIYKENATSIYSGIVTQKIALLIANEDYANFDRLLTPKNDVEELALIFQNLGFETFCFLNLNLHEMKVAVNIFGELVKKGAYAIFYYAGHGFSSGDAYLLPVDCPGHESITQKDCVRESMILKTAMEKQPALCIVFLDMCLKQINRNIGKSAPLRYKSNRNLICAYSTTSHKSSYEKPNDCTSIYVTALKKYLGEKMPILAILNRVNAEIALLCPKQMPTVTFITAEDFLLCQEINATQTEDLYKNFKFEMTLNNVFIFKKYKGVYSNVYEFHANCEILNYETNAENVQQDCKNNILIIPNIQKLEDNLTIVITTKQGKTETTIPTLKFSSIFKNV